MSRPPATSRRNSKRIGHELRPLEIVVVNTAAGARYGQDDFVDSGCGMGKAATLWLAERGVRVVGTDAWSWDAPFSFTREKVKATGDVSLIWEGHRAGREIGYFQMEKLGNLAALPARRIRGGVLPGEGASRLGRMDPGGRDFQRLTRAERRAKKPVTDTARMSAFHAV